ncbi:MULTISPECIES: DUF6247 family protein [unclassified Streptomyces]|uniref:DUF6247 family protein n=1 Tax=unclassified Streptomyces TaxID=2593676 RepID=UPI0022B6D387|nr:MULTISPECIES: DUF6247 family protein [unclassified Streptomyces]MCZ7416354.1 hypothetical protein [Streptomyces sp. WMMC897]MCZ7433836.1 hypothetical protein [Streptomyces sp. WMMC1477]
MAREVDTTACEKTPAAIRAALERRPDWLRGFEQDFLSAAAEFDQAALDTAVDRWFPAACACATPGYLDQVENDVRRVQQGDTEGMIFRDAEGNAYDAQGTPLSLCAGER